MHDTSKACAVVICLYNRSFGPEPALLAEAMQVEPSSCGQVAWDSLPHIQKLLEAVRSAEIPVVYSVPEEDITSVGDVTLRETHGFEGEDSRPAPWGNTVHEAIAPRADEVMIRKSRASVFFGTILDAHLRQHGALFDMHLKYSTVVSSDEALEPVKNPKTAELVPVRSRGNE